MTEHVKWNDRDTAKSIGRASDPQVGSLGLVRVDNGQKGR